MISLCGGGGGGGGGGAPYGTAGSSLLQRSGYNSGVGDKDKISLVV